MGHLINAIADRFAERILSAMNVARRNGRSTSALRGRKLDMHCRYPGCESRSKGPRFRFLCEQHLRLPKKEQSAALEKWKGRKVA